MIKKLLILSLGMVPAIVQAVGYQGSPQIYALSGKHPDQVVMLTSWSEGKRFAEFEDDEKIASHFFAKGQRVWTWCDGKSHPNSIENIETKTGGLDITTVYLRETTNCNGKTSLMSNYEFPKQTWNAHETSAKDAQAIRQKLASTAKLKITTITSQTKGTFYLVFEPGIQAENETEDDTGGYRLLDARFNQISTWDGDDIVPLIDLDNDGVPEFFMPSSDGMESFLIRMFPRIDTELEIMKK
jgi:hypothetical protein